MSYSLLQEAQSPSYFFTSGFHRQSPKNTSFMHQSRSSVCIVVLEEIIYIVKSSAINVHMYHMCNNNSASVRKQVVAVNVKPRRRITSVNLLILQTNALPPTSTFDKVCPAFQIKSQQLVACCYFVAVVALLRCCLFLPK